MSIQLLSKQTIEKIAAGEVLERPANLVKELIENSMDANSTEINIEVANGGRSIIIQDNGKGIHKDELVLALTRHATSKIKNAEDLWSLNSFGFRGEALASISAVSNLRIASKYEGSEQAFALQSRFSNLSEIETDGLLVGTRIVINDLFENVPARLKFLKSDSAEVSQIKKVIKALAMVYPHCQFRLVVDSKLQFYWPRANSVLERTQQILENKDLYYTTGSYEHFELELVFSAPNKVSGNSQNIWIFVQNRWVQDKSLQTAIMTAYENLLMHGEFPVCALFLKCNPEEVDVNVHPTKSQIKFREPSQAFRAIRSVLRSALEQAPWIKDLFSNSLTGSADVPTKPNESIEHKNTYVSQSFNGSDFDRTQYQQKPSINSFVSSYRQVNNESQKIGIHELETYSPHTCLDNLYSEISIASVSETNVSNNDKNSKWASLQVLGQANLTYIIAQSSAGIILVDQHAAHERIAFERLMNAWKNGGLSSQSYLLPDSLVLDPEKVESLLSMQSQLKNVGIEIEQLGPDTVGITSSPVFLKDFAVKNAIIKIASELQEHGGALALDHKIADVFASMACHSVVRAGQALSIDEMQSLLKQMDEYPLSSFCPHGRPVYIELSFAKIEKDFGRTV